MRSALGEATVPFVALVLSVTPKWVDEVAYGHTTDDQPPCAVVGPTFGIIPWRGVFVDFCASNATARALIKRPAPG